ncbi:MAG TPA: MmgE/PrpD family protein [Mesorhizobium sp.]|nr:MmgE/PrpD family protein [Mesorhizobium sp.]
MLQPETVQSPDAVTASGITSALCRFVEDVTYGDFPPGAVRVARRCVLDGLGLFVAGSDEASVVCLADEAAAIGGRPDALLLGRGDVKVPAPGAARVLGTAGHAHDWDDTQVSKDPRHIYGLLTHPTVPALASALAVVQMLDKTSGRDFLTAFLTGYEVECKVSEWMLPQHYKRGFHSSGTVGTFAACAATAKLLGLKGETLRHAVGIAASMASGIRVNFGTMTKPLHVGRACENGVTAALLAARGFTADPEALDGPWGFFQVFGGGVSPEKIGQGFGDTFSIVDPGVSIKPYPSGILTHQSMDAMLKLVTDHDVKPEQIERIDFFAGSNILNPIRYPKAANHLQAKFSMAALLAMIALRRRAGREEFVDEFVGAPAMQDMQDRIATHLDPQIEAQGTDLIRSRIELTTRDGRRLVQEADVRYRGGPDNPMTDRDLEAKVEAATGELLDDGRRRALFDLAWSVESLDDARVLARAIQP